MRLFRAARPQHLPLDPPRLDGAGWPDAAGVGRPSFETSTYYELAVRNAFEPEAHAVADRLVDELLPRVETGVSGEDAPYLRKTILTAARVGAGVGIVERTFPPAEPGTVDRAVAGALWEARRRLPGMQPGWSRTAGFFLLAGFHVVRGGPSVVDDLARDL
ncbi:MAG: hypothetical protein JWN08_1563 [Frankiales bacterium]|nr:hypothetical protein [Frankiales bacterium]